MLSASDKLFIISMAAFIAAVQYSIADDRFFFYTYVIFSLVTLILSNKIKASQEKQLESKEER